MRKSAWAFAFCLLALLETGCASAAGPVPQSVGSLEPTEASLHIEALADTPPPAVEEFVEIEDVQEPEEPDEAAPALDLEEVRALRFEDVPAEDPRAGCIGYAALRGWMQIGRAHV